MADLPLLAGFYWLYAHYLHTQKKKEAKNIDLHPRKSLAEVHGNRTHLPPSADGTPDLKSGGIIFSSSSYPKIFLDNPFKIKHIIVIGFVMVFDIYRFINMHRCTGRAQGNQGKLAEGG